MTNVRNALGIGLALAALAAFPCHGQNAEDNTPPSCRYCSIGIVSDISFLPSMRLAYWS